MRRLLLAAALILSSAQSLALPVNATLLCTSYPEAAICRNGRAPCAACHAGPPALNPFGGDVEREISTRPDYAGTAADFERYLGEVLHQIEDRDSDGDGVNNRDEIRRGHGPGDAQDHPSDEDSGAYDFALALKRLSVTYCGNSPTYEENKALAASTDKRAVLSATLARCLASDFWRKEALPRLADEKVRPVEALGVDGNPFVLSDYSYDYRLFVHALTEGRDARDLVTADYHVGADGQVVRGVIPDRNVPGRYTLGNGQPLQTDRRAGMITTQWFIAMNTMFAVLPRNTAAQAYRSYLGLDVAKSEGLFPIEHEPRDVDHMRVAAPECAVCHSTLDPLAYPFSPYVALNRRRPDGSSPPGRTPVGSYDSGRTQWEGDGYLFGEPVTNLLDWARKAAESDAFKINLARMFYRHALGRDPSTAAEQSEFEAMWRALAADGYSANKLLHRLVETRSFGAPGPATATNVVWKRHQAIARDLGRALELTQDVLCKEVGLFPCTSEVFLTPLGGNEPFKKSQYRPAAGPTVTTPVALERVVLSACSKRVEADFTGTPAVFRAVDLEASTLVGRTAELDAMTVDLYRRLLGRDPLQAELAAMHELTVDGRGKAVAARDVAKLACFVIGSSREFAFN